MEVSHMQRFRYFFFALLLLGLISSLAAQDPNPEAKLLVTPREVRLEPGQGQRFEAILFSSNGTAIRIEKVQWTVVPDTAGKISEDGFFIAGRREGEAKIIATAFANNVRYVGEAHVVIGKLPTLLIRVVVEPKEAVVAPGESQQFKAIVVTSTGEQPVRLVKWLVEPMRLGKISETGLFTAGSQPGQGAVVALVEFAGVILRGAAHVTVAPAPTAVIAGQVLDEQTQAAIGNAVVWAERIGDLRWSRRVETDAEGKYVLEKLIPGVYVVRAEARGYLPEYYDNVDEFSQASLVELAENQTKDGINFSLSLGASIAGLVAVDNDAKTPIAGAHVIAVLVLKPDFKHHTVTNENGEYVLAGLPTGTYVVLAEAAGYRSEFYDNALNLQGATPISVTAPDRVEDINLFLATSGAIAGRVTDFVSGEPIAKALVSIHTLLSTTLRPRLIMNVFTNENGEYIASVPPGFYLVAAEARGYHKEFFENARDILTATPVQVLEGKHTTGINFPMDKLASISGLVTDQVTGESIAGAIVTAFPERPTNDALVTVEERHIPFTAKTNDKGEYVIENVPTGKFRVHAEARGYLVEYWQESPNIEGSTPVEVPESGAVENINFTLGKGGAISGTVFAATETDPAPLGGAVVQVWAKDRNAVIARAKTERDGKYRIEGLRSGEYIVFASAEGFHGLFYDGKESRDQADPVKVEAPDETGDLNFVLKKIETRGGTIAGVVVSEADNTPIPHALVLAIPLNISNVPIPALLGIADNFGHYKLAGLPPGKYVVIAGAPRFLWEFYKEAKTFADAEIIVLAQGTVREDVDFTLTPAQRGPYHIAGRVRLLRQNRGAENAIVQAIEEGTVVATAVTNADGSFTLDEMPAGEYKLFASTAFGAGYFGGTNEESATPVAVGNGQNAGSVEMSIADTPTGVDESSNQVPAEFALEQNYPNPFNPETSVKYQLPVRTNVSLRIYNALGQEVRTLVNGLQDAGFYTAQWDGKDNEGRRLSTGIYLVRLEAGDFTMIRKMAMVK
jgi:type IV secretory pathway protease TraF